MAQPAPAYYGGAPFYPGHTSPLVCSSVALDLPPEYTNNVTPVPATDHSPEALLYRQFPKIAQWLANRYLKLVAGVSYADRLGNDHYQGAENAIARAISVYILNVPFSFVQNLGWEKTLAWIISQPLFAWDPIIPVVRFPADVSTAPLWLQKRANDFYSVHPALAPFYFWKDEISFYRFVRYSPQAGFGFSETFKNKTSLALQTMFAAMINTGRAEDAIGPGSPTYATPNYDPVKFYAPTHPAMATHNAFIAKNFDPWKFNASVDGFEWCDRSGDWLTDFRYHPRIAVDPLLAAANNIYSHQAANANRVALQMVSIVLAVFSAGATIAAIAESGTVTVLQGVQLLSFVENLPTNIHWGVLKTLTALSGEVFNLVDVVSSMGLDVGSALNAPAASPPVPAAPAVPSSGVPAMSVDSVPTIDPSTGIPFDLSANPLPDIPSVNVAIDPAVTTDVQSTITQMDYTAVGTDPSTLDQILNTAQSTASDVLGNFDLSKFVNTVATAYKLVTSGQTSNPNSANRPSPGQTIRLKDGSVARTNADGSTTITAPNGAQQTILPSGKVIAGVPANAAIGGSSSSMLLVGAGLLALALIARR